MKFTPFNRFLSGSWWNSWEPKLGLVELRSRCRSEAGRTAAFVVTFPTPLSNSKKWRLAAFLRWDPTVRLASGSLEALTRQNCTKEAQGYSCNFCGRPRNDFSAMKLHMEACHFPSYEGHTCDICQKHCKTSHALACHKSRYHKVLWVVAECTMLCSWAAYLATKWKYIFSRAIITFWARPWPWERVWKCPSARRPKELSLPRLWKVLDLL